MAARKRGVCLVAGRRPALPGKGWREGIGQQRQRYKDRCDEIRIGGKGRGDRGHEDAGLGNLMAQAAMVLIGRIGLLGRSRNIIGRRDRRRRRERLVKMALKRQAMNEKGQQREQRDETPRRGLFQGKAGGD